MEIEMLRQIFKSLILARQASAAFETLRHLTDHQNIKAQVLAEMDAGDEKKPAKCRQIQIWWGLFKGLVARILPVLSAWGLFDLLDIIDAA